jgi:hypothetical protein
MAFIERRPLKPKPLLETPCVICGHDLQALVAIVHDDGSGSPVMQADYRRRPARRERAALFQAYVRYLVVFAAECQAFLWSDRSRYQADLIAP